MPTCWICRRGEEELRTIWKKGWKDVNNKDQEPTKDDIWDWRATVSASTAGAPLPEDYHICWLCSYTMWGVMRHEFLSEMKEIFDEEHHKLQNEFDDFLESKKKESNDVNDDDEGRDKE